MKQRTGGFGLVETLLALVLGLVISLALTQMFLHSKSTYLSQASSAALQEDARFVLSRMAQEIRLVGVFGCQRAIRDESLGARFAHAFNTPVRWDAGQRSLTLISAATEVGNTWHEWIIHTDCTTSAVAWSRGRAPSLMAGEFALPIQQHVYRFNAQRNELTLDGQPLLSHVRDFSALFGVASSRSSVGIARYTSQPDPALIRSVRLTLVLFDPADRTREQTFHIVATIRNRAG